MEAEPAAADNTRYPPDEDHPQGPSDIPGYLPGQDGGEDRPDIPGYLDGARDGRDGVDSAGYRNQNGEGVRTVADEVVADQPLFKHSGFDTVDEYLEHLD